MTLKLFLTPHASLSRSSGDAGAVFGAVAAVFGVPHDELSYETTLWGDLGAHWLDLIDILAAIERATGLRLRGSDMARYLQGQLLDEAFADDGGLVRPAGLDQLERVLP